MHTDKNLGSLQAQDDPILPTSAAANTLVTFREKNSYLCLWAAALPTVIPCSISGTQIITSGDV